MSKRIFVTGATGFIGSATVRELLDAGYEVLGLVRSDDNATALAAMGGTAVRGSLEDLDSLRRGAETADGVVHTAFIHDFTDFAHACAVDQRAIETIGEVLAGSDRPFSITSGTPVIEGRASVEADDVPRTNPVSALRARAEDLALELASRGVRSSVVRMPRAVHGVSERGWHGGFAELLLQIARAKGESAYIGDGSQRWPAVHRLDAARLFRLAIDKAPAGARLHAVGDEGIPMRELAEAIGRVAGVPVTSKAAGEAAEHFGFLAAIGALDQPASSPGTSKLLDWHPREPGLLADLAANAPTG